MTYGTKCVFRGDPATLISRMIKVVFNEDDAVVSPDSAGNYLLERWRGRRFYMGCWPSLEVEGAWETSIDPRACVYGVPYDRWTTAEAMVLELLPDAEVISCSVVL